jgi:hypothetical protein
MLDRRNAAGLATSLLLAAAIAAPAAAPATRESGPATTCHQYCGTGVPGRAIVRTELVPGSGAGFHWADAAVGFAVACGGILLIFLTVLGARRMRFRTAHGAS